MKSSRRTFRNFVLPLMILAPLLWLMIGCVYVPWFEHRLDGGRNVRAEIGPADSDRHVRPGSIRRETVRSLLGRPQYETDDGSAEAYITRTGFGIWVAPLCFTAAPADEKVYAVRLDYDKTGLLRSYQWAEVFSPFFAVNQSEGQAVEKLNRAGSTLRPYGH